MGKWVDAAMPIRQMIDVAGNMLTDAQASVVPRLYGGFMYDGSMIPNKTRRLWTDGCLYIAMYDTYDRVDTDPEHDTNGWKKLSFHNGYRDIPDVMYTADMFMKDEIGWRADHYWQSLIDNNSWTPEAYPAGWQQIEL